jgi:hypothetical protein
MFYFTKTLTKDTNSSFLSSAFLTGAIPFLLFGDAVLTDMAGYFFILLGTYLVIRWDLPRAALPRVCIASLVVAAGILSRESVASVLIFAAVWTILTRGSFLRLALFVTIPVGIAVIWSSIMGVSYLAWYAQGGLHFAAANQQLGILEKGYRLLGSIQYGFVVVVLAALGLLQIRKIDSLKIHASIWIGALVVISAWPIIDTRFTFILFPSIMPLAGAGSLEAFSIIFRSRLLSMIRPSFKETKKSRLILLLFVIAA